MATAPVTDLLESVLEAIDRGDAEGVLRLLEFASEGSRRRIAPRIRTRQQAERGAVWMLPSVDRPSPQRVAAVTARVATETPRGIARLCDWDGDPVALDPVLGGRAIAARGGEFAASVADRLLEPDRGQIHNGWPLLRWLVRNGVAPRPDDPRYVVLLATSFTGPGSWGDPDGIYKALLQDPDLLEVEIWRLFEVDVVVELDQQRVFHPAKGPPAAVSVGKENRWHRALIRLARESHIDRDRLLNASLAALGMDFRASRMGWHGELHEGLEPTPEERTARIPRYAALLSSSNPAVVRVGLAGLEAVIDRVPANILAQHAAGPLSLKEKKYALQTLRLLEDALDRGSDTDELLAAIAKGLAHGRPDVQERALQLLERNASRLGTQARAEILGVAEAVAPTLRARVDDLLGLSTALDPTPRLDADGPSLSRRVDALEGRSPWRATAQRAVEQAARGQWPDPRRAALEPDLMRRSSAAVAPVETLEELIEVAAQVLEGDGSAEDVERFLDGACRLCDHRDASTRRRVAALLKRADERLRTPEHGGASSSDIAALLLRAWFERDSTILRRHRDERLSRIAATVLRAQPRSLEALPTHVGGWVDPVVLEERKHRRSDPAELALAEARAPIQPQCEELAPRIEYFMDWRNVRRLGDARVADRLLPPRARGLSLAGILAQLPENWTSFARDANRRITDDDLRKAGIQDVAEARRRAGDPVLVFDAPGGGDDPATSLMLDLYTNPASRGWKRELLWAGDRGAARWLMSLYPSRPDVFFALAATNAHVFAEDNIVYGFTDVALERACEPIVEIGRPGWFMIACALLVRSAHVRRLATDVVATTISDGRFDPQGLAGALGWLLAENVGNPGRFTSALADAARISPLHGAQVLRSLCSLIPVLNTNRRGIHEPLELALQLATELGLSLEEGHALNALDDLVKRSPRSKAGTLAQALAARPRDVGDAAALKTMAADAIVAWAESLS